MPFLVRLCARCGDCTRLEDSGRLFAPLSSARFLDFEVRCETATRSYTGTVTNTITTTTNNNKMIIRRITDFEDNNGDYEEYEYSEPYDEDEDEDDEHDGPLYTVEAMQERLDPAMLLSQHSIPTVVWGLHILMFAHSMSGNLVRDLHILVEDHLLETASQVIQQNSELYKLNTEVSPDPHMIGPGPTGEQVNCFPLTTRFTNTEWPPGRDGIPPNIFIHPASFFQFDASDRSRSISIEGLPEDVRFPTLAAWIDSLFDTIRNSYGEYTGKSLYWYIEGWLFAIDEITLRARPRVLEGGRFNDECLAIMDRLKEENRPVFKNFLLGWFSRDICNVRLELDETGKRIRRYKQPVLQPSRPSSLLEKGPPASGLPSNAQVKPSLSSSIPKKLEHTRQYSTSAAVGLIRSARLQGPIQRALRFARK
ncbi:hypothetical protein NMY22_g16191 [Coprinellus aureogranulatus]|nr:hypothetical protein NMY22_g16191 [Coprinellus aureogranulatus]